ncbi:aminoacyl-tRNA hydrolase [Allohahella sp. A8]|uniref:aminoacyl-tRNA hydrolase n=1 Tax=Allohahella sp. A8 TaxID=3141461 RepID=UPI003A811E19
MTDAATTPIRAIIGLGNPGNEYAQTRHNAGAMFVERLATHLGCTLKADSKFFGHYGKAMTSAGEVHLLIPATFMNRSGQAVGAMARFYKLEPVELLVAYDELDLPPGTIRLKASGGHGGHNGIRDIIQTFGGQNDFHRLRLGIGHPGHKDRVTGYVLGRAPANERELLEQCFDRVEAHLPSLLKGNLAAAMNELHRQVE